MINIKTCPKCKKIYDFKECPFCRLKEKNKNKRRGKKKEDQNEC